MITLKECEEHIKNGGALNVNGWCITTLEKLHDGKSNYSMDFGREEKNGKFWSRANSYITEITDYPDNIQLISIKRDDIDSTYEDEIVCPHCGYNFSDSWEVHDDCKMECDFCDQSFELIINREVSYSTYKEK